MSLSEALSNGGSEASMVSCQRTMVRVCAPWAMEPHFMHLWTPLSQRPLSTESLHLPRL